MKYNHNNKFNILMSIYNYSYFLKTFDKVISSILKSNLNPEMIKIAVDGLLTKVSKRKTLLKLYS